MSWENNIESNPEKFGLEVVASIDYSTGCYEFDTRIVWRQVDGTGLLSARDAGCSCPMPFEHIEIKDCQEVTSISWINDEIAEERKKGYGNTNIEADSQEFLSKVSKALEELAKVRP